jgi:hypothetical protein
VHALAFFCLNTDHQTSHPYTSVIQHQNSPPHTHIRTSSYYVITETHFGSSKMSKAASARAKFAELRALRESGKKRLDSYEVNQEADLYEEVDEDGYKKVVRERLNQDDFVVDDNGEGYADDGREEWDRRPEYDSESEEELPTKGKAGKAGKSYLKRKTSGLSIDSG